MDLTLKVFRFRPGRDLEPTYQRYIVAAEPQERILDALRRIQADQDDTLSFRSSCAHGVCGSCAVRIDGRCGLACQTLARGFEGRDVTIEPLPGFKVLKDLMVDLTPFFDRVALIRPFLVNRTPPPEKERLQTPADQGKIDEAIRCILCASCVAACPVTHGNPRYIGPAPLVQAFRRVFDSRDEEMRARLKQLAEPDMAEACTNRFECTRVCPKEIKVTKTINTLKREIAKHLGEGKGGRA